MVDDRSMNKDGETEPDMNNIPSLRNFYIPPKHKKISGSLKKIDKYNARRYQEVQNLINIARGIYSIEYVKSILSIAKTNSKSLMDFELSEAKEQDTLKMIASLQSIEHGICEEDLTKLWHTIEYISDLENRLSRKGFLKKMSLSLRLTNKISKEGGEKR